VVLATSGAVPDDPHLEVVLPMAHPYERQGTVVNLEGRVQHQEGGASPPSRARSDWHIAAELAARLGVGVPGAGDVEVLRRQIASEHPALAEVLREEALVARV
jgi:NADH dehydrogenase/NADH:ubiquinone oxidoreductase subunit G